MRMQFEWDGTEWFLKDCKKVKWVSYEGKNAVVFPEKLLLYVLNVSHPDGRHKANMFAKVGFTLENWHELYAMIMEHAHTVAPVISSLGAYGIRGESRLEFERNETRVGLLLSRDGTNRMKAPFSAWPLVIPN